MAWDIYRGHEHWVPPVISDQMSFIDPARGVFFDYGTAKLFLAVRDGRPVGRISAQVSSRHDERAGNGTGFFGFFECEDNPATARALFEAAEAYLREQGRRVVEGPFSFAIYDEIGVLLDAYDEDPYVFTVYNPPYYPALIEGAGYRKSVDWHAFRGISGKTDRETDRKFFVLRERAARNSGLVIRPMDIKHHLEREKAIVQRVFGEAWGRNWGHVPLSDREMERFTEQLKPALVPELSLVAELNGEPVGMTLSTYDVNQAVKKINGRLFPFGAIRLLYNLKRTGRFRLILMGVLEQYRNMGIHIALIGDVMQNAVRLGFAEAEMSLIVETNEPMLSVFETVRAERSKTYRIYRKELP